MSQESSLTQSGHSVRQMLTGYRERFTCRFRHPNDAAQERGRDWGTKAKPSGAMSATASSSKSPLSIRKAEAARGSYWRYWRTFASSWRGLKGFGT